MRRTMFQMGFSSPVQGYGPVRPGMGLSLTDVTNLFKGVNTPAATPVAPAAPATILGMDQGTFMLLGALLLGGGLVIAVVAGRKAAKGPKTAPARAKVSGRR